MTYKKPVTKQDGLTLIEILLVIAILTIMAGVVIVAINPGRQFVQARDAERQSEVYVIVSTLHQYALDHESSFPSSITTEPLQICRTGSESCAGKHDLSVLTDDDAYLLTIPVDPICEKEETECEESETGYILSITDTGRIMVSAPYAELEEIVITK